VAAQIRVTCGAFAMTPADRSKVATPPLLLHNPFAELDND
jgi:hypothetical protein